MDLVKMASLGYLDIGLEKTANEEGELKGHELAAHIGKQMRRNERRDFLLGGAGGAAIGGLATKALSKDPAKSVPRAILAGGVLGSYLGSKPSFRKDPSKNLHYQMANEVAPGQLSPEGVDDIYRTYGADGVGLAASLARAGVTNKRGNVQGGIDSIKRFNKSMMPHFNRAHSKGALAGGVLGTAAGIGSGLLGSKKKVDPLLTLGAASLGATVGGLGAGKRAVNKRFKDYIGEDFEAKVGRKPSEEEVKNLRRYNEPGAYFLANEYMK